MPTSTEQVYSVDRIAAVIVTYEPKIEALRKQLDSLKLQISRIIIIDNHSSNFEALVRIARDYDAFLEPLPENTGIAFAQNVGIHHAKSVDVDFALLMDQDSVPEINMVSCLLNAFSDLEHAGLKVAGVGPRYIDGRYDELPCFNRVQGIRMARLGCQGDVRVVKSDYLIASGTLIPLHAFDVIGEMSSELFIDYIDIEWGLRAKAMGYSVFGICQARLDHSLGENPIRFLGRHISVHNPIRNYYFIRNALIVYRKSHVPWNWVVADLPNVCKLFLKSCVAGPKRWLRFRYMMLGFWDGLLVRTGPIPVLWR